MERYESHFKGYGDCRLNYQTWSAKNPVAHLILTHGQSEHSDSYSRVVEALKDLPLKIWIWDWRGHGKSDGLRGYAQHFSDYVYDFELFMKLILEKIGSEPRILMSHSMGGLIQLKALIDHPQWNIDAQILSSPLLGIAVDVPLIKKLGAHVLNVVFPRLTLGNEIDDSVLSRDPLVLKEFKRDAYRHGKISSGVYLGSVEAMKYVLARPDKVKVPTLLQIPLKDRVVDSEVSSNYFEHIQSENKVIKIYKDRCHEIYNDLGREEVFHDLTQFISQFLP